MPLVPIEWLREHVAAPADLTATQLATDLVRVGLEEEEIHLPELTGPIVVGKVLTLEAKEQSNGKIINYCRVDVGEYNDAPGEGKEPAEIASRGIICGAHNFTVDDYVVVALPGAILPGDFKISARKTYGHISDGMICSQRELGAGDAHDGIWVLARGVEEATRLAIPAVGQDVLAFLGLSDEILEINVTPDRGYCFAMRGIAREYAHSTGAKFTDPALESNLSTPLPAFNNSGFSVIVDDAKPIHGQIGCDRFVTRIVRGVDTTAESPKWLQKRLLAAGMRPISLIVDATNYVMLDLGQPLHAYDLAKVTAPLVVRRAEVGETLVTLDEVERKLATEDLVITDSPVGTGSRVVGLAGVMGGASTEITSESSDVLIEAAHFDPITVARAARRHRLPSEAAKRFERGADPQLPPYAAQAVVDLLVEYGGGTAEVDNFELNTLPPAQEIVFHTAETERISGLKVDICQQIALLEEIGCVVRVVSQNQQSAELALTVPSWRPDLVGSAHFVEEIARLVGYDEIPTEIPHAVAGNGLTVVQRQRREVLRSLAELGWVQVLSYPFVSAQTFTNQEILADDQRRSVIRLANPLQEEAPFMRTSILDSLLETARLNVSRGNPNVAICESSIVTLPAGIVPASNPGVGRRPNDTELYALNGAIPAQPYHVAGLACGQVASGGFDLSPVVWDWRDAIAAVQVIAGVLGVSVRVQSAEYAPFHPGRCAQILAQEVPIGYAGELAAKVCKAFELPVRSVAFEIDLDVLSRVRGTDPIQVAGVSTFPVAKEDLAFVVDMAITADEVAQAIKVAGGKLLEDLRLFDVYVGDQVPEGKKSLAFALRLRGLDHTLSAQETAQVRDKIIKHCAKTLDAQLRG